MKVAEPDQVRLTAGDSPHFLALERSSAITILPLINLLASRQHEIDTPHILATRLPA
jgi:hypothetical protein